MKKYFKYLKQVLLHKKYVFEECRACGILWQGLIHDLSKFSKDEFVAYSKYFMEDKEKNKEAFIKAWMHHKGNNPHHWEYWIDYDENGNIVANKMPYNYVVEMVCDWIGAGKAYEKEKWKQSRTLEYYNKVRKGRHFHPETEHLILNFLVCIKNNGLDEFHKMAKDIYLRIDYEEIYLP